MCKQINKKAGQMKAKQNKRKIYIENRKGTKKDFTGV